MDETISLTYRLKPFSLEPLNESFTLCKCYVMALGKNANLSYFEREAVDNALPTLPYVPAVAHLMWDEETKKWHCGGHDMAIDKNHNFVRLTIPYGVVVDDSFEYVDVEEPSGAVNTYLTCSMILWTGLYPDLMKAAYSDEVYFNQSMEVHVNACAPLSDDNRYKNITGFTFYCLTLLGKSDDDQYNVQPCFPEAKIVPFSKQDDHGYMDMYKEMIRQISKLGLSVKLNGDVTNFFAKETTGLNEKIELLAQYGLTIDDIDFSLEDIDMDDLSAKLQAEYAQPETTPTREVDGTDPTPESFALSLGDQFREVGEVLSEIKFQDNDWLRNRYWLEDLYTDRAIVVDVQDHWHYFSIPLSWNGDVPSLSFDEAARVKREWVPFEDGASEPSFILPIFTEYEKLALETQNAEAKYSELEGKYNEVTSDLEEIQGKYQSMVEDEIKKQRDELFGKFESELAGDAEFEALRDDACNDLEAIETKLYSLVGKKKFSSARAEKPKNTAKYSCFSHENTSPYNGLIEKYRNK